MNVKLTMVGIPEHWQVAHDRKPDAFLAQSRVIDVMHMLARKPFKNPLQRIMRHFMIICVDAYGAVTTLLLNGYSHDALRLTRTIWEGSVTVAYLRKHPKEIKDFTEYSHIISKKSLDNYDLLFPKRAMAKLSKEQRAEIEKNYDRAKARFLNQQNRVRSTWCKKNIFEMAQATKREAHYKTFYTMACAGNHLNVYGIGMQTKNGSMEVDIAPTVKFLETALITAHGSVIGIMDDYNRTAKLGLNKEDSGTSRHVPSSMAT